MQSVLFESKYPAQIETCLKIMWTKLKQMKETDNYLNLVNDREPDVNLLNFMEYGSDDYVQTKLTTWS